MSINDSPFLGIYVNLAADQLDLKLGHQVAGICLIGKNPPKIGLDYLTSAFL